MILLRFKGKVVSLCTIRNIFLWIRDGGKQVFTLFASGAWAWQFEPDDNETL